MSGSAAGRVPGTSLDTSLRFLKGVGPRRAGELERAGLGTVEDLLFRLPLRYEDRGRFATVASLRAGQTATVSGEIAGCGLRSTRRPGFTLFEALVRDESGAIESVWFNQRYLRDVLTRGQRVVVFGKVDPRRGGGVQLTNPQFEIIGAGGGAEADDAQVHTGRIVPVYERIGSLTPKMLRALVHGVIRSLPDEVPDPLPEDVLARMRLPARRTALAEAHFPERGDPIDRLNEFRAPAQVRLIFEEYFQFQAGLLLRRRDVDSQTKPRTIRVDDRIRASARAVLPFALTAGQKQALAAIVEDLKRPRPMNRLLQGDVGAGKTIVALLAALVVMENGLQVAVMAPTEILAEQHYLSLRRLLGGSRFRVASLTGSTPARQRRLALADLASGEIDLVVGTHALAEDEVSFRDLGLVVIDEQHRFGVMQRATLRGKGGRPDVLVMTATPIPRTLALTTYGDLDVSTIRDLPPGRQPVRTTVKAESRRDEVHRFVARQIEAGRQAFIVYPLVEESQKIDLRAATAMADHLAAEVFPAYRVGLIHGRMKVDAKERVMTAFAAGELDVLVATTVIEVGIDVPNATVMVVEHAERFGLAQLHQLRGRVGRGTHPGTCVLLYQPPLSDAARARLRALAASTDGFLLAERDLEIRGPGDFFGTRQSGVPLLRIGDLLRDHVWMERARREAEAWLSSSASSEEVLTMQRGWARRFGLVGVG